MLLKVINVMEKSRHLLVKTNIINGLKKIFQSPEFKSWMEEMHFNNGDLIVINNSFFYRKYIVKTIKNNKYLCCFVKDNYPDITMVSIIDEIDFNTSFKKINSTNSQESHIINLDKSITNELNNLGSLIYVLIGDLFEAESQIDIQSSQVKRMRYIPNFQKNGSVQLIDQKYYEIIVNSLQKPDLIWAEVENLLLQYNVNCLSKNKFFEEFSRLTHESKYKVAIPTSGCSRPENSFLIKVIESVKDQIVEYKTQLDKYKIDPVLNAISLNDVMRIAYNFSEDVTKILRLLISISDLKAIVLWCSIYEQYISESNLREIPGMVKEKKASLGNYCEFISDARNQAFHNLFTFDRTIEAELSGVTLKAKRLTFLPEHGKKETVLDYEDREMIELLSELTRAKQIEVDNLFWDQNFRFMESLQNYLVKIEESLWLLFQASTNFDKIT